MLLKTVNDADQYIFYCIGILQNTPEVESMGHI
jgi:hypothetical protein